MAASILNQSSIGYLRLGAAIGGIWYGFSRQISLERFVVQRHNEKNEINLKLQIEEARVAYEAKLNREEAEAGALDNIITDSDSYRFSADRWLDWAIARTESAEKKK